MTFVDTSVWIAFLRGGERTVRPRLEVLLDEDRCLLAVPVRVELLGGAGSRDWNRLTRLLGAVPTRFPSHSTWALAEAWCSLASRKGERFGMADLLIGAIAHENGGRVWSLDEDFARMARLGFVELDAPDDT